MKLEEKPWLSPDANLDAGKGIPKMMRPTECAMLYHIARDVYTGWGEIVDCGTLVGASSASLVGRIRAQQGRAR